jgi:2-polyprenyl-6-methoxyphenol hydroxylase-like FAD-dependent oxidoreductase
LRKHADFLRDFRGDSVHPLMIMQELGLLQDFLQLPHSQIRAFAAEIGEHYVRIADFAHVPVPCKFVALMPQWDFLNFLADKSRRLLRPFGYPAIDRGDGAARNRGPRHRSECARRRGLLEIEADLVVGCDGRTSTVRMASGLAVQDMVTHRRAVVPPLEKVRRSCAGARAAGS